MQYDKKKLRDYLTNAAIVATTSGMNFIEPISGERMRGAISLRTDGNWIWFDSLADHIDKYNVAIPVIWYNEIVKKYFIPPCNRLFTI